MKASRGVIDCSDACPRSSCEALVRIARICMPQGELKVTSISPPKKSIAFARGLRHTWTIEQHVVGRAARKPRACETTSAAKVASTSGTREPSEPRGAPAPPRAASPASGSAPTMSTRRWRQGRPLDRVRPHHDHRSPPRPLRAPRGQHHGRIHPKSHKKTPTALILRNDAFE